MVLWRTLSDSAVDGYGRTLAMSPDGVHAAVACSDVLAIWDVARGRLASALKGHTNTVADVAFTPDGKHVLSTDISGNLMRTHVDSGKMAPRPLGADKSAALIASAHGGWFGTGPLHEVQRVRSLADDTVLGGLLALRWTRALIALAPDGRIEVVGDAAARLRSDMTCVVGKETVPVDACEDYVMRDGLLVQVLRGERQEYLP